MFFFSISCFNAATSSDDWNAACVSPLSFDSSDLAASVDCHLRDQVCDDDAGCAIRADFELNDENGDDIICCVRGVCVSLCVTARLDCNSCLRNMVTVLLED